MIAAVIRGSMLALSAALAWLPGAWAAAATVEVELVRGGEPQELPAETQSLIAARLPELFASCSLNSRDHAAVFAARDISTIWRDTLAQDHLRVRFAKPVAILTGASAEIPAEELVQGLHDPRFPGPELSRHGKQIVGWTKCSGIETIRFVCTPEIRAVMPEAYHGLCQFIAE